VRRRRWKRAIGLYRWVLAVEAGNPAIHLRIAPLLARTGQDFDAWRHFRIAALAHAKAGHAEEATGIWRKATRGLPQNVEAWVALAEAHRGRGHQREAVGALLEGRSHFKGRHDRPQAIHLLRRVRRLRPTQLEPSLDLVRLLAQSHQCREAVLVLEALDAALAGRRDRCRIRAALFRVTRRPGDLWRWLQVVFSRPTQHKPVGA